MGCERIMNLFIYYYGSEIIKDIDLRISCKNDNFVGKYKLKSRFIFTVLSVCNSNSSIKGVTSSYIRM